MTDMKIPHAVVMIRLTGPEWQENMRKRAVERDMAKVAEWRAEMKMKARLGCGVPDRV